jgi:hypothetical protein
MLLRFLIIFLSFNLLACASQEDPPVEIICQLETCEETGGTAQGASAEEEAPTSVTIPEPATTNDELSGSIITAVFDEDSQVFTLTALGLDTQLARFPSADFGRMLAMRDVAGVHNAYFAQGEGSKIIIYSGGMAGSVRNLASFGRIGATELPLVGGAQFNGDYAGFTTTRRINGRAHIDVDFKEATLSGRITQRIFRQRPDNIVDVVNPLSMLVLEQTTLKTDGTFGGETGGGQIVNGQELWNPASGSFTGLIGGANAGEVVGTVNVTHRTPSGGKLRRSRGIPCDAVGFAATKGENADRSS